MKLRDYAVPRSRRRLLRPRLRKPNFLFSVIVNTLRVLAIVVLMLALAGVGAVLGIARAYVDTAPSLDLTLIDDQAQTSFIYDENGNLITDYKGTENRVMVSISEMTTDLQHAFVAVEDARFYTHNGVDLKRIVGALIQNFTTGSQQGGSTITQQLIKNTILSSEQSYKRKIQEAYLAMQLENQYTKEQILESYLNTIYLGENYYGVYTAARGYFGKKLNELSLRECAMLAGLCTNPYYYNPRRNFYIRQSETTDYTAITNNRTDYALRMMYENQFITHEQYISALDHDTAHVLETDPDSGKMYDNVYYVEYAIGDVVRTLLKLNGLENTSHNRNLMENELRTGGYHVYLCLDTQIQKTVEDVLYNYTNYPALRDPADSVYRARNSDGTYDDIPQPQAAAVVLDYRTGELKAIVGSRTPPTRRKTLNRASDMNMPVGSAIKPIAVYAPALELSGLGAGAVTYNMPLPISGYLDSSQKETWPQNYGGSSYRGPETLRTALAKSDNTAAAWVLMNYVGVDNSYNFLRLLGVSEKHINKTPFGLALGSSGITPVEMAAAYGALASGGLYQEPISFLGIADSSGNVIYDSHARQQRYQAFSPSTAWLTVDMMKDAVKNGTATKSRIDGQTVAGKTGTNSDQKGVFFAGMTGWYCGTVWIGHDNYKALSSKITGGNSAAALWNAFMSRIHQEKGLANRDILEGSPEDYGLVKVTTCSVSGQLATDACRHDINGYGVVTDYWPRSSVPTQYCQMHMLVDLCAETGQIASSGCPSRQAGIIILPPGHPLYDFIGTQYEDVLTKYLGRFAVVRTTGDENYNRRILAASACTVHGAYGGGYDNIQPVITDPLVRDQLLPDARSLLASAQSLLQSLPYGHPAYAGLQNAIDNLNNVIGGSPTASVLTNAMAVLTQAMAAARN
ncbi:MAG: transglycosylase domain-containing protein [Clostridia bacterium]|nr:transglycosylase domain-containing protein [Clostridia bacterium]